MLRRLSCQWFRSARAVLAAFGAALAMIACGASDGPTKPTSTHAKVGIRIQGGGQRGFVGQTLSDPIAVQLIDSSSLPIAGKRRVRFAVANGGGSLSDTIVLSGETGVASVSWMLGQREGQQELTVSLADASPNAEQRVVATALPLEAADLVLIGGATSGTIGVLVRKDAGIVPYTLTWPDTVLRLLPRTAEGTSEEVTAFTVGHPPVSVPHPWTDGVDTVRVAFQPPIPVRLTIWITQDYDSTLARARSNLDALDAVWRSRMTGLRVGEVRFERAPNFLFVCRDDMRGNLDRTAINIYYLNYHDGDEACDAQRIRMNANGPLSLSERIQFVLAHEIGHAMSLDHLSDLGNIMWPVDPGPGPGLTTGQIYWMHFHNWGALNSVLGVHPIGERDCNVRIVAHCPAQTLSVW